MNSNKYKIVYAMIWLEASLVQDEEVRQRASRMEGFAVDFPVEGDDSTSLTARRRAPPLAPRIALPQGWRARVRKLVCSWPFESFFAFCIITNGIFLGMEVEYFVQNPDSNPLYIEAPHHRQIHAITVQKR